MLIPKKKKPKLSSNEMTTELRFQARINGMLVRRNSETGLWTAHDRKTGSHIKSIGKIADAKILLDEGWFSKNAR